MSKIIKACEEEMARRVSPKPKPKPRAAARPKVVLEKDDEVPEALTKISEVD